MTLEQKSSLYYLAYKKASDIRAPFFYPIVSDEHKKLRDLRFKEKSFDEYTPDERKLMKKQWDLDFRSAPEEDGRYTKNPPSWVYIAHKMEQQWRADGQLPYDYGYTKEMDKYDPSELLKGVDKKEHPQLWWYLNDDKELKDAVNRHTKRANKDAWGLLANMLGTSAVGGLAGAGIGAAQGDVSRHAGLGVGAGMLLSLLATTVGMGIGYDRKPRTWIAQYKANKKSPLLSYLIPGKGAYEMGRRGKFLENEAAYLGEPVSEAEAKDFYAM